MRNTPTVYRRKRDNPYNVANPLYKRLTRLLSGPITNYKQQSLRLGRKKDIDKYKFTSASGKAFKKSSAYNPFKEIQAGAMANASRAERYMDFDQMEFTPELSTALDVYADEITTYTQFSPLLKINSPNQEIADILTFLFYEVLNIELNAHSWTRTVCKYGDLFLYLDIDKEKGITNVVGLPPSEIERLEGEDPTNPNYVQFQWNAGGLTFENWQIAHIRILGNDKYIPYGSSILEGARRIWKQLSLLEDAVMAYRIVRCLPFDSIIQTENGYKYIGDINVGDKVYSYNNDSSQYELSKVTNWVNNGPQQIWKVKTLHRTLNSNDNHPILVKDKKTNIIDYIQTKDLKPKRHQIYVPRFEDGGIEYKKTKIELKNENYVWYGSLSEEGKKIFLERKYDFSIRKVEKELEEKHSFGKRRINQFLYTKGKIKGLPLQIAKEVVSILNIPESYLKVYPRGMFNLDRINLPEYVNEEFARFFGFMVGDGFLTKNKHKLGFATGIYSETNQKYADIFKKYDSSCIFRQDKRIENPILGRYEVNSQYLSNLFIDMGFTSSVYTKTIPSWIFASSPSIKEAFIDGLIDADGWIKKDEDAYHIELCNKKVIEGLKELCHQLGWNVTSEIKKKVRIRTNEYIGKNKLKKRYFTRYTLYFTKHQTPEFENIISVKNTGKYEDVYDIRVDNENHNFVANGMVVHNSPERRVFKIDVGGIDPKDVPSYMEQVRTEMKRNQIVDPGTGRVDLRYNPLCHFPNDFIYLCDGTMLRIGEVGDNFDQIQKNKNGEIWTWGLDNENNVIPTKLIWAGKTKEGAQFVKVTLDDGQIIKTTPEHKWILRDGTEIEAQKLKTDDSLMPFYAKVDTRLTLRHGSKDNFYPNIYSPNNGSWNVAHSIVAKTILGGDNKWPNIIHHVNHIKFNNDPRNLQRMTQSEHALLHERLSQKLINYAKSDEGRQKSKDTFIETHKNHDFGQIAKDLWQDETIRSKRIDKLTLKTDSRLIKYTIDAIDELGTSAKEYEIREWLNNNESFKSYLVSLNQEFKNGFNDQLTKNQFRYALRNNNFNNLRTVKDFYVAIKAPWDRVLEVAKKCKSRKEVFQHFGISKWDFTNHVQSHNMTLEEFDERLSSGGYYGKIVTYICEGCGKTWEASAKAEFTRFCSHDCYSSWMRGKTYEQIYSVHSAVLNHKVVSIEFIDEKSDAYGLTVEHSRHAIAIGGENAPKLRGRTWKSGVFMKNSIEEDYFIPVRKGDSSTIDTLKGGQYTGDIDDIKYFRDKLFTALKIPAAYLSQGEGMEEKGSLAQKDIMFARTIIRIQNTIASELRKVGIIHLATLGYTGEDLTNFDLMFHNPSRISELQELEYMRTKFSVAVEAKDLYSQTWIDKYILTMSDSEIVRNRMEKFSDVKFEVALEQFLESGGVGDGPGGDLGGMPSGGPGEGLGGPEGDSKAMGGVTPPGRNEKEEPLAVTPTEGDMAELNGEPRKTNLSKVQKDARRRESSPTEKSLEPQAKGKKQFNVKTPYDKRSHSGPRARSKNGAGGGFMASPSRDELFNGLNMGLANLTTKVFESEEIDCDEALLTEISEDIKINIITKRDLINKSISNMIKANRQKNDIIDLEIDDDAQ